jgi:hypothetical protein
MDAPDPLSGLRLAVSPGLAGSKRALLVGDTIYLSPAMHDLLTHAEGEELMRLCMAIEVIRMPAARIGKYEALPMTAHSRWMDR